MRLLPFEYAVRNLGRSPVRLILSLAGSTLVVLLVLAAGAFVRGMDKSLAVSAGADNVILLGAGSEESVQRSEIRPDVGGQVAASVGGIKSRLNVPYVSPEVHMAVELRLAKDDEAGINALVRGITPSAFLVHERVRIIEGEAPAAGRDQVMIGRLAATRLGVTEDVLAIGKQLWLDGRPWTITAHFEAPGTVMEAEVWMPLSDLQIVARRDNLSCVILTLDDTGEFGDVDAFTKQRLDLELVAMRESDYYAKLSDFYTPVQALVWVTAGLIAVGGLLGGLNTMYAAFASRVRELGTLQAVGYPRRAIVLSLVQESVLTTVAAALLAAVMGALLLDGLAVRFSIGAFGLVVDGIVMTWALATALLLGIIGALPPALRCLRMPVAVALKAA